ncbi:hypothetical protein MMC21_000503 [Puttea exsequens]|nr:hypothetical protein [Puttea exsequens]
MAYNSGYNPDALPAHAEPEQAAQILSSRKSSNPQTQDLPQYQRPYSNSTPQPYNNPQQQQHRPSYQDKPPPPLPPQPPTPQPQRLSPNNTYTTPHPPQTLHSPPPPNYGFSPPPPSHSRPSPPSRPPATPQPTSPGNASLFPLFKAVDTTGTGQLSEKELSSALVNGDFTSFDPHTVSMMMRMFATTPIPGSTQPPYLTFPQFTSLWTFLAAWRALFERFDTDGSGYISLAEYGDALVAFGYRLSGGFVGLLYGTFERGRGGRMSFDLFVQSCIVLKRMTDVFKGYDEDRDGYVTLSFEEFLTEILKQRT